MIHFIFGCLLIVGTAIGIVVFVWCIHRYAHAQSHAKALAYLTSGLIIFLFTYVGVIDLLGSVINHG